MSRETCKRTEASLWRYIDRELPAKDIGSISGHLRECPSCRQLHDDKAREVKLYRLGFESIPFGEGFVERFRERFSRTRSDAGSVVLQGRPIGRRFAQWAAIAAIIALVPALVFFLVSLATPGVETIGRYEAVRGAVQFSIEGGKNRARRGVGKAYPLRPGSRFEVAPSGAVEIVLESEEQGEVSRLEVAGPATFEIPATSSLDLFVGRLKAGALSAHVLPRSKGEGFAIETPDAVARIVGTRFRLEVRDLETRLKVDDGEVSLSSKHGRGEAALREAMVTPADGWYRVAARGAEPEALAPEEPPAHAETPAPEEPDPRDGSTAGAGDSGGAAPGAGTSIPETSEEESGPVPSVEPRRPLPPGIRPEDLDTPREVRSP